MAYAQVSTLRAPGPTHTDMHANVVSSFKMSLVSRYPRGQAQGVGEDTMGINSFHHGQILDNCGYFLCLFFWFLFGFGLHAEREETVLVGRERDRSSRELMRLVVLLLRAEAAVHTRGTDKWLSIAQVLSLYM